MIKPGLDFIAGKALGKQQRLCLTKTHILFFKALNNQQREREVESRRGDLARIRMKGSDGRRERITRERTRMRDDDEVEVKLFAWPTSHALLSENSSVIFQRELFSSIRPIQLLRGQLQLERSHLLLQRHTRLTGACTHML